MYMQYLPNYAYICSTYPPAEHNRTKPQWLTGSIFPARVLSGKSHVRIATSPPTQNCAFPKAQQRHFSKCLMQPPSTTKLPVGLPLLAQLFSHLQSFCLCQRILFQRFLQLINHCLISMGAPGLRHFYNQVQLAIFLCGSH